MSKVRWAIRPDGTLRPVAQGPRCRCQLCGRLAPVRSTWEAPRGSRERYCIDHWSVDDRRLRREFGEANP